jgi:hypothetical protein
LDISTNPQVVEKWKTYPQKQRCGNVENSLKGQKETLSMWKT